MTTKLVFDLTNNFSICFENRELKSLVEIKNVHDLKNNCSLKEYHINLATIKSLAFFGNWFVYSTNLCTLMGNS